MSEQKIESKYIDKDPPMGTEQQLEKKNNDYLAYLKEKLNFILGTYGRRLTSANGEINELVRTAEETTSRLSDAEGDISAISQRADNIEISVAGKVGENEVIAKINTSPEQITIDANRISITGFVTFSDLSTAGNTTINGANITTGLIKDAQNNNSWNLNTGEFTITNGSINITTSNVSQDIIQFNGDDRTAQGYGYVYNTKMQPKTFETEGHWYSPSSHQFYISKVTSSNDNFSAMSGYYSNEQPTQIYAYNHTKYSATGLNIYRSQGIGAAEVERASLTQANGLRLYDSSGTLRQDADGEGKLWQYDANGKKRTYLEYGDIFMYTSAEKKTLQLSAAKYTSGGSLQLFDASEVERVRETVDEISIFNSSGTEQTKIRKSGDSSWYTGRYYASLINKVQPAATDRYHPALSTKAYSSDWSIGALNNNLYFVNTTDSAYNNGQNRCLQYTLDYEDTSGGSKYYSILTTKNTNDRVVSSGTSGIWRYRKWASGWLECWGTIAIASHTFAAWGTGYYSPEVGYTNYPVAFSGAPYEVATPLSGSGWVSLMSSDHQQTATKCGGYRAYRPVSGNASFGVEIYAMGTAAS